jgi:hypothetical protein
MNWQTPFALCGRCPLVAEAPARSSSALAFAARTTTITTT